MFSLGTALCHSFHVVSSCTAVLQITHFVTLHINEKQSGLSQKASKDQFEIFNKGILIPSKYSLRLQIVMHDLSELTALLKSQVN